MTDLEKVLIVIKHANEDGLCLSAKSCYECPLRLLCDDLGGMAAGKVWLFDHGFDNYVLKQTPATKSFDAGNGVKIKIPVCDSKLELPDGVVELSPDMFRDGLRVRLFAKDFKNHMFVAIGELFTLARQKGPGGGTCWALLSDLTIDGYGFKDGSRIIATDLAGLLFDTLVVGCDETVLNPAAHKRRNFRKIKT